MVRTTAQSRDTCEIGYRLCRVYRVYPLLLDCELFTRYHALKLVSLGLNILRASGERVTCNTESCDFLLTSYFIHQNHGIRLHHTNWHLCNDCRH